MRINCPECGRALSLDRVKPGSYRPTCKHCTHVFRLKITHDDPPQALVGKLPSDGGTNAAAATLDATVVERTANTAASRPQESRRSESEPVEPTAGNLAIDSAEIPERLGGYKILRLLGRGAMGSVFEAKQISLDRRVALKTIRGRLTENPASLARFAREAYAAAQLTHHNIVQIYDFGEDAGRYFFSMEWVRGGPLDRLIREKGSLDPRLAAGYTLQAARGLQFAHRQGMVHRDIKPANLLLSDDGVIKVADLGLVKIPDAPEPDLESRKSAVSGMASGTQVTMHGTAVGTPAYMAPEQGMDAATVDHRADIYSLGCSLFCMLTGRPPFEGTDVSKVLEQHAQQPFPSVREASARVPAALEQIIAKSTAKSPAARYASIAEMIRDLESFLGIRSGGSFSPAKSQADQWESISHQYSNAAPGMRLAKPLTYAWTACCLLTTVIAPMFTGIHWWMLGPSMWLISLLTAAILAAHVGGSAVMPKLRAWIASMSWVDWTIGAGGLIIAAGLLAVLGFWPGALLGTLIGATAAAAIHVALLVPASQARAASRHDAERFVRDLRLDGADETGLREFIARYSGPGWQSLFEDLFGYDALSQIRQQLATDPSVSKSIPSPTLRDKICDWLAAKTRLNVEARDRRQLTRLEARGLAAEGVSAEEARDRAWQIAEAIMENVRSAAHDQRHGSVAESEMLAAQAKRERMKAMLADARSGRYRKKRDKLAVWKFLFAGQTRLLAGCLLLAWFAVKGQQAGVFDAFDQLDLRQLDLDRLGSAVTETASTAASDLDASAVSEARASLWSSGVAGLLLCMSAFVSGWRMTPFALAATFVMLLGPAMGIPSLGPLPAWIVAILVAVLIYIPGIVFGETVEE